MKNITTRMEGGVATVRLYATDILSTNGKVTTLKSSVEQSEDTKFGFFKRPTKVEVNND